MVVVGDDIWAEIWRWEGGSHQEIWGKLSRRWNSKHKGPKGRKDLMKLEQRHEDSIWRREWEEIWSVGWKQLIAGSYAYGKEFQFYYCINWRNVCGNCITALFLAYILSTLPVSPQLQESTYLQINLEETVSKHSNRTHASLLYPSSHVNVEKVPLTAAHQHSSWGKPWHYHSLPILSKQHR